MVHRPCPGTAATPPTACSDAWARRYFASFGAVRTHRIQESIVPTQRSFRNVLGCFATGVVLVTARTKHGPAGMTANSFTSVSLDPPLIALCAARTSTTWPYIRAAGAFAVTILGDEHEDVCRTFATRGADRFAGRTWKRTPAGHPLLPDGLGWLDCEIETIHPAGDHELAIARATRWSTPADGPPLIFHSGRYTSLPSSQAVTAPTVRSTGDP